MSDLIERLERTPEYIDTDEDQRIADLCDEAAHEILRLRNRVKELEETVEELRWSL
jgi:polyhydroxyalkanoate synthesis regulator phasin